MDFNNDLNMIETLISTFTIENGIAKVLLLRKKIDPYKGYWVLPGSILTNYETLEDNIIDVISDKLGTDSLYIEQSKVFSKLNRNHDNRIIACSFIGIIDSITIKLNKDDSDRVEMEWFPIGSIPKLGYDHEEILNESINHFRKLISDVEIMRKLFPSDFTLPELQNAYENILNKKLDRRNFRKKFINLGLIELTGDKSEGSNGRPAKYYSFKNTEIEEEF